MSEPFMIDRVFPKPWDWPHDDGFVAWLREHDLPTTREGLTKQEEATARLAYLAFCAGWNAAFGNATNGDEEVTP